MTYKPIKYKPADIPTDPSQFLQSLDIQVQDTVRCTLVTGVTEADKYKLLAILDYRPNTANSDAESSPDSLPICEINRDPKYTMILGGLGEKLEERVYEVVKMCYCNSTVKLGNLIQPDPGRPEFACPQKENTYTNMTIGKVLKIFDDSGLYFSESGQITSGEYAVLKRGSLQLPNNRGRQTFRPPLSSRGNLSARNLETQKLFCYKIVLYI